MNFADNVVKFQNTKTKKLLLAPFGLKMKVIERDIELTELPSFSTVLAVNAVRGVASMTTIDERAVLGHASFNDLNKIFFEER